MSHTPLLQADVSNLVSPMLSSLLIGYLFTWGLQGIFLLQVYNYYIYFPKDQVLWKVLVYTLLVIELLQTILATVDAFKVYSTGWGNALVVDQLHLLWLTLPIMSSIVGFLCHFIFAYRLYVLSDSWIIGSAIVALALTATGAGLVFGIKLHLAGTLSRGVTTQHIYLACGLWNGAGAVCDIVIAACMTYFLSRSNTGYKKTDLLITRIIRLTIETGVFTATASLASLILFVGFRNNLAIGVYFVIPAILLAKLYSVTILAMFNNRAEASGGRYDSAEVTTEIRVGRSVVQQVWTDDIPIGELKTYGSDSQSLKSRKSSDDCKPPVSTRDP